MCSPAPANRMVKLEHSVPGVAGSCTADRRRAAAAFPRTSDAQTEPICQALQFSGHFHVGFQRTERFPSEAVKE